MAGSGAWCLIESDPGVFTELIRELGVKDAQVEELYSLDEYSLNELKPVHGLIFLFKWVAPTADQQTAVVDAPNVFFAQQVIQNACATQAILSILMNCPTIDLGPDLTEFKTFVAEFPPELKGTAIGNSSKIREVHNSFSRPDAFLMEDDKRMGKEEDAFHFVAYVPVDGRLYELDGLKPGPVDLGPVGDNWLKVAAPAIEQRIQKYSADEIRFNLMAVIGDRKAMYTTQLEDLKRQKESGSAMDVDGQDIDTMIEDLQERIRAEDRKLENYKLENVRRKHNYIPFFINTLRLLAERGQLMPLVEKAKEKARTQGPTGGKK